MEVIVAILLNLIFSLTNPNKPASPEKTASDKDTTITTNKSIDGSGTRIGSGGWDPNN